MEIVSLSISEHAQRQDKVAVCNVGAFVYVKQEISPCNRPWLICLINTQTKDQIMSHMAIRVDGVFNVLYCWDVLKLPTCCD